MNKKATLRSKADKLWYQKCLETYGSSCEICWEKAVQVHHFYRKGSYANLRYNILNGVPLCTKCHFRIHHQDNRLEDKIRDYMGEGWYSELKALSKKKPESFQTIGWYNEIIKELEN